MLLMISCVELFGHEILDCFSGPSVGSSGMLVKTKLSLMLCSCKSRIVSFVFSDHRSELDGDSADRVL